MGEQRDAREPQGHRCGHARGIKGLEGAAPWHAEHASLRLRPMAIHDWLEPSAQAGVVACQKICMQ